MLALRTALLWAIALPLLAGQPGKPEPLRRVFVEPFKTQAGADKLRADVILELHKIGSLSVAVSESGADAILDGGGEIWVKGYRSLNPRSGRMPSDGTPIYDGYLAVELKDSMGQTFWSYLATPGAGTQDVSKGLAKRIAKQVSEALERGEPAWELAPLPQPKTILTGAGATFLDPVYEKWFKNYRRTNPNVDIRYASIGSEAGIHKLLAGEADFGASDNPEAIREMSPDERKQFLLFPSVVGAVVPVVNLPGVSSEISLSSEALAGIYLGNIKKWNDPVLRRDNRGVRLPDLDIVVVHRADGSGTSYAWTDYLSRTNPEWKTQVGSSMTPKWPVGKPAKGNDGVAKMVKELGGSIGYVEFIYALQNHVSYTKVRNRNGEFVGASLESMAVAANAAVRISSDFKVSLADAPGAGAYPIASFTWLVVPAHFPDEAKRSAVTGFLRWMLGPGQMQAAALGYLALPDAVVTRERAAVNTIQ